MKINDWIKEARGWLDTGQETPGDLRKALDLLEKALVIVEDYDRVRELVGETDYKIMSEYLRAFDEAAK